MRIAVITNDRLKEELLSQGFKDGAALEWYDDLPAVAKNVQVCIDLLFDTGRKERTGRLAQWPVDVVIVNDVTGTGADLPGNFVRINGWPTFLKRGIAEASCSNDAVKDTAEKALSFFNKRTEWIQDIAGFITPRIVCAIINEAFFSLQDNVSGRGEIDAAMKLGTNYPYGPFEWNRLIGSGKVYSLLSVLSSRNHRYTPCDLLKKESAN